MYDSYFYNINKCVEFLKLNRKLFYENVCGFGDLRVLGYFSDSSGI